MDRDDADVPPYYETLGIEIRDVESGYAEGLLPADERLSLSRDETILHGGAIASLADATGYWAVSSANDGHLTPTIDLRIDFLAPATGDLTAEAEVVRNGASVGVADVIVETGGTTVATARGVFKTGGSGSWNA
jgi:uncharacterized protein (TIGR00369 family)